MEEETLKRLNDLMDYIETINDNPWIKGKRRFAKMFRRKICNSK